MGILLHEGTLRAKQKKWGFWVGGIFIGGILITYLSGEAGAASPTSRPNPLKADTSQASRRNALNTIPFDKLTSEDRSRLRLVVAPNSIFRRLPIQVTPCDPEMYFFLVRNPDVVVNIWQVLGVTALDGKKIGPGTYRVSDGEGMHGVLCYLYSDHETHLIYTEGYYEGPLLNKRIECRSLVILKSGYIREPDGRYYITSRLDTFTRLAPVGAEFAAKTFHPLVGKVADHNFAQTAAFVGSLSRTAELKPQSVVRLAHKLNKVEPEIRQQFADLSWRVAQKAVKQAAHEEPRRQSLANRSP